MSLGESAIEAVRGHGETMTSIIVAIVAALASILGATIAAYVAVRKISHEREIAAAALEERREVAEDAREARRQRAEDAREKRRRESADVREAALVDAISHAAQAQAQTATILDSVREHLSALRRTDERVLTTLARILGPDSERPTADPPAPIPPGHTISRPRLRSIPSIPETMIETGDRE